MTELILALDVPTVKQAIVTADSLQGSGLKWMKVGKQLFTAEGPVIVRELKNRGFSVFLDMKYHDIPNTVAQAVRSALTIGADMVNFHAGGGSKMIRTAMDLNRKDFPEALLIAVTVLTSMDQQTLDELGLGGTPAEVVERFARIALAGGADGVVCSAHEIEMVQSVCGKDFQLVVPGIRPPGSAADDQKRIMTPAQAAQLGAQYIVVGRPIMKAEDPAAAVAAIQQQITI